MPRGEGVANLIEALDVRRNAIRGFGAGVALAAGLFVVFVVLPGTTSRSPVLYVALGAVLAVAAGMLVTAALVARAAHARIGDPDGTDEADERGAGDQYP